MPTIKKVTPTPPPLTYTIEGLTEEEFLVLRNALYVYAKDPTQTISQASYGLVRVKTKSGLTQGQIASSLSDLATNNA